MHLKEFPFGKSFDSVTKTVNKIVGPLRKWGALLVLLYLYYQGMINHDIAIWSYSMAKMVSKVLFMEEDIKQLPYIWSRKLREAKNSKDTTNGRRISYNALKGVPHYSHNKISRTLMGIWFLRYIAVSDTFMAWNNKFSREQTTPLLQRAHTVCDISRSHNYEQY